MQAHCGLCMPLRYIPCTFYFFSFICRPFVDFLMHDIVLIALIIAWLFEWIKCLLYVMFVKLTLMFSWKHFGIQLRYASLFLLYECLFWYDCFIINSMLFSLRQNHFCFFFLSTHDLLINYYISLNLVSKDLFKA